MLSNFWGDLRYAARSLRRTPGFAAVAILTLGVGIGASSSIFSVAYGILFRSLPFERSEQLVSMSSLSPPNFMSIREENRSFTDVAVYDNEDVTLTGHGESRWVEGAEVSAGFFEVMGAKPVVGRTFLEGENLPGADGVAVISYSLWQELTGGRADMIGQTLVLHARPRVVVGVMPARFDFPYDSDVWIPLEYDETYSAASAVGRRNSWLNTVARLRDGTTLDAARSDLTLLADRLERRFPEGNRDVGYTISISPLRDSLVGSARTALLLLLASVGLLLLIACANVAGLFLARAASRQEELAVRVAIGAGRGRLVRQLMTESLLVGLLGGALGLLLTTWGTRLIVATPPEGLPRIDAIRVDATVVAFGLGVTMLAVLLTGLVPAWQATRTAAASRLRAGGRSAVVRSSARMRPGLVTAEIALAVVLLVVAGLLMKSFVRLTSADPGFRTEGAVAFMVRLPDSYDTDAETLSYYDELFQRLRALPGVEGAGAVHRLPMAWNAFPARLTRIDGLEPPRLGQEPSLIYRSVTPGYFEAMRIPVLSGRDITQSDRAGAPLVAVINETAARRLFGGEDPLGQRMSISVGDDVLRTVVGIVGDVVDRRFTDVQEPEIFLPFAQAPWSSYMSVVVRGSGDPLALVPAIRSAVQQVDPNVPARDFRTLERVVGDSVASERFLSSLLGMFAAAALLLAAIGVFGLFSFTVAERTGEIAVRTALGARRVELVTMVLGDALKLTGVGLVVGVAGAAASTRVIEGQLYGVSALDPVTFGAVIVVLTLTAIVACLLPACRAAAVDPMTALRRE